MSREFFEEIGLLKHHYSPQELEAAELKLSDATIKYLHGEMDLPDYKVVVDHHPKLDLVQLAQELNLKG